MFSKLTGKLDSKLDRFKSGSGGGSQADISSSGDQREPLDASSKRQLFRYRYWRGVNLGTACSGILQVKSTSN